ncbi:tyrosine-type recombinase/integrase [Sulfitobacter sp. JL08]|uniref:tyrosine-type recombinase/integrase n=1 Tax=Sulfitobacter sp. JL08 TaxID=2070369 RepID=UPI00267AE0DD
MITQKKIRDALPAEGRGTWRDPDHPGLEMMGNQRGGSWYLRRRVDGKRIRDTLGRWPGLTVSGARKAAEALVGATALKSAAGGDPLADREAKRQEKAKRREAKTVKEALDMYAKAHLATLRSGDHAESVLRRVFAKILLVSLADMTKPDVIECVDARREAAPSAADQAVRYAKPFWGWIAARGYGDDLLVGVKVSQTNKRDRTLSVIEMGKILVALDEMGPDSPALVIRTLIATAGRLNEVAGMQVSEVEGDLWTLPPDRNKSNRVHLIPLNAEALAAISQGQGAGLVFPGRNGPYNGWSRFKSRLDKACGVRGWVFHDFRRSFATICKDRGVDAVVADRCLNHAAAGTQSTVMRIYQRSEMLDQRRAALDIWSDTLAEARGIAAGGTVVALA